MKDSVLHWDIAIAWDDRENYFRVILKQDGCTIVAWDDLPSEALRKAATSYVQVHGRELDASLCLFLESDDEKAQ